MKPTVKLNLKQISFKIISSIIAIFLFTSAYGQDGKAVFKQNCAACHKTSSQLLVGPGLEGITTKRSEEWLIKWIKNSQDLVKAGDADAVAVFEQFGKQVMPPFNLSDAEIKACLEYINASAGEAKPSASAGSPKVVAPSEPQGIVLTTNEKYVLAALFLLVLFVIFYGWSVKARLRKLGYGIDKKPLRDQLDELIRKNGKLIVFCVVVLVLFALKIWISNMNEG